MATVPDPALDRERSNGVIDGAMTFGRLDSAIEHDGRVGYAGTGAPATPDTRRDAVAAAALTTLRRALVEGVPVTRAVLEREACINLDTSPDAAMRELDTVCQSLGVSSLG
jgi:hypothetical protein